MEPAVLWSHAAGNIVGSICSFFCIAFFCTLVAIPFAKKSKRAATIAFLVTCALFFLLMIAIWFANYSAGYERGSARKRIDTESAALTTELKQSRDRVLALSDAVEGGEFTLLSNDITLEQIQANRQKIAELVEALELYIQKIEGIPNEYRTRTKVEELPSEELVQSVETEIAQYESSMQGELQEAHKTLRIWESLSEQWRIMEKHYGHWSIDTDGIILFDETVPDEDVEAMEKAMNATLAEA